MGDRAADLSLSEASSQLLEECRMVLPGIQTLLGFQLIAVFQRAFSELSPGERQLHLAAVMCVVAAVALVMSPAVLHRSRQPQRVSQRFVAVSSALLMWSMLPLAVGTSCDIYLVARLATDNRAESGVLAALAVLIFAGLWVVFPKKVRLE